MITSAGPTAVEAPNLTYDQEVLRDIARRVLWLSAAIVDAANAGRPNHSGVKVGGHQASSASMVDIMTALWFAELAPLDRVSVKPHASPVLHAINYLLGDLDESYLPTLRAKGGLQSYPSRLKDPGTVDFSTGSVGIGATAALWAAVAHRYIASQFPGSPPAGRFISLLGDAELDEGAIWEGATWSRWGERLIPLATLYDPFVSRALEPWSYGIYSGGQSILAGTPSGVTLAPEGGAHQSVTTPSIGLEQPGCIAWEPAFAQDLEWCVLYAMERVGVPGGTSSYFRLSTRPIDPALAQVPGKPALAERRRQQALAGGYRMPAEHPAEEEDVTLVGVGAIMPETIAAGAALAAEGVNAGVICLTSPDLVFRSFQQQGRREAGVGGNIADELFPLGHPAPLVTVLDGHPHTLAFLAGVRGDRIRCLGVTEFGQSSSLDDAYRIHHIDTGSIVERRTGHGGSLAHLQAALLSGGRTDRLRGTSD